MFHSELVCNAFLRLNQQKKSNHYTQTRTKILVTKNSQSHTKDHIYYFVVYIIIFGIYDPKILPSNFPPLSWASPFIKELSRQLGEIIVYIFETSITFFTFFSLLLHFFTRRVLRAFEGF